MDTDTFVQATQRTLGSFLVEWLDLVAATRVRPRTLQDYRSLAERYLIPSLGHRKISQLAAGDIQQVYSSLRERGLSPRTIRYAHSVLHNTLEQAVKWNLLARNVAKLVVLPRNDRREMSSLTVEQSVALLNAAPSDRFGALWMLLLTGGMRPGEALAAKWSDLEGNKLRIQRGLVRLSDNSWQLAEPKTPRARRALPLPASTLKALASHRTRQCEERLRTGPAWTDQDLIFTNATGGPLDYRVVIRRHLRPLLKSLGLGHIRPYDLRHTCATLLLASGENVKVVSERLGHASATLTLDTYSHVLPDMQQRAAERLESLLFAAESTS
jgi:integrase